MEKKHKKEALAGILMVLPTIVGLIALNFYPLIRTVYMSFLNQAPLVHGDLLDGTIMLLCFKPEVSGKQLEIHSCLCSIQYR